MQGDLGLNLKMSEQEVQQYMEGLLQKSDLAGMESQCLYEWKRLTQDLGKLNEALVKAQQEVERLKQTGLQMQGQRAAYMQLLINAEEGRRNAAEPKLELVDAKK